MERIDFGIAKFRELQQNAILKLDRTLDLVKGEPKREIDDPVVSAIENVEFINDLCRGEIIECLRTTGKKINFSPTPRIILRILSLGLVSEVGTYQVGNVFGFCEVLTTWESNIIPLEGAVPETVTPELIQDNWNKNRNRNSIRYLANLSKKRIVEKFIEAIKSI